jgi:hypothetical protein
MRTPFEISEGDVQEMPDLPVFRKLHDAKTKSREFAAFLVFAKEKATPGSWRWLAGRRAILRPAHALQPLRLGGCDGCAQLDERTDRWAPR